MDRCSLVVRLRKLFGVCCQCISYCPADRSAGLSLSLQQRRHAMSKLIRYRFGSDSPSRPGSSSCTAWLSRRPPMSAMTNVQRDIQLRRRRRRQSAAVSNSHSWTSLAAWRRCWGRVIRTYIPPISPLAITSSTQNKRITGINLGLKLALQ